mmetsp:Transcript_104309/g.238853  ORF Transcript_104309/g.238853 Transcript_104309/m.238853 type:complete len:341 (+) Transcript_104309:439-1461(+)
MTVRVARGAPKDRQTGAGTLRRSEMSRGITVRATKVILRRTARPETLRPQAAPVLRVRAARRRRRGTHRQKSTRAWHVSREIWTRKPQAQSENRLRCFITMRSPRSRHRPGPPLSVVPGVVALARLPSPGFPAPGRPGSKLRRKIGRKKTAVSSNSVSNGRGSGANANGQNATSRTKKEGSVKTERERGDRLRIRSSGRASDRSVTSADAGVTKRSARSSSSGRNVKSAVSAGSVRSARSVSNASSARSASRRLRFGAGRRPPMPRLRCRRRPRSWIPPSLLALVRQPRLRTLRSLTSGPMPSDPMPSLRRRSPATRNRSLSTSRRTSRSGLRPSVVHWP